MGENQSKMTRFQEKHGKFKVFCEAASTSSMYPSCEARIMAVKLESGLKQGWKTVKIHPKSVNYVVAWMDSIAGKGLKWCSVTISRTWAFYRYQNRSSRIDSRFLPEFWSRLYYLPKICDFRKYVGLSVFWVCLSVCLQVRSSWITGAVLLWLNSNLHRMFLLSQGRNLLKFSIWPWRSKSLEVKRS